MRWVRRIALILGAAWFFPVSCTIGMSAGPYVVSRMDARDVKYGEELHPLFKAVAGGRAMGMDEIERLISEIDASEDDIPSEPSSLPNLFLLSAAGGRFESEYSIFTYTVLEDSGDEQLIELREEYKDGDNTIWSRYKARRTSITPLSTRMFYFGYIFTASPFVFFGTLSLFLIGRILLSVTETNNKPTDTVPADNSNKYLAFVQLPAFILGGIFSVSAAIQTIKSVDAWIIHLSGDPSRVSLPLLFFKIFFNWFGALVPLLLGYFVTKRRQLDLVLVLSLILCIFIPFGTIVGITSFAILSRKPVKQQFLS